MLLFCRYYEHYPSSDPRALQVVSYPHPSHRSFTLSWDVFLNSSPGNITSSELSFSVFGERTFTFSMSESLVCPEPGLRLTHQHEKTSSVFSDTP